MKPLPKRNDTVSVIGLGRSGRALISHLTAKGIRVHAFDDAKRETLGDIPLWLSSLGVPLYANGEGELRGDFVFRSPSVRPDAPRICRAALRGATVWGEAEYFAALCPCPIYAVTGSDGKTTTATMLSRLLSSAGRKNYLGGNIGRSLLPFLSEMKPSDACVLELSSFQLMDFEGSFHTGIVTNLSPNHLNWHTDFKEYAAAKLRLAELSHLAVLDKALFPHLAARRFSYGEEAELCVRNGYIYAFGVPLFPMTEMRLRGVHNLKNLLAAAAALAETVTLALLLDFARRFGGVPHRMEWVAERQGVTFINSSIDTTPTRTAATVAAYESGKGKLLLLLGGKGKKLPLAPLEEAMRRVGKAYLFGDMEMPLADFMKQRGLPYLCCGTMEAALLSAYAEAESGDSILLSPGATAYDAYLDYEERGEAFRKIAEGLPE